MRRCKKCEKQLPETDFSFCRSPTKVYRRRTCRVCVRADRAAWRTEYLARNSEKLRAYHREYMSKWRLGNPEAHKEATRRNYLNNKDAIKCRVAARRVLVASARRGSLKQKDLLAKALFWGNRCWMCRGPHEEWDHVKPLALGGLHVLANLRPSCRHCNRVKGKKALT